MIGFNIERYKFIDIFREIDNILYYDFDFENEFIKTWEWEDEFFILEKETGILVSWYKHLGRANYINKNLSEKEIRDFATKVLLEIKEEVN